MSSLSGIHLHSTSIIKAEDLKKEDLTTDPVKWETLGDTTSTANKHGAALLGAQEAYNKLDAGDFTGTPNKPLTAGTVTGDTQATKSGRDKKLYDWITTGSKDTMPNVSFIQTSDQKHALTDALAQTIALAIAADSSDQTDQQIIINALKVIKELGDPSLKQELVAKLMGRQALTDGKIITGVDKSLTIKKEGDKEGGTYLAPVTTGTSDADNVHNEKNGDFGIKDTAGNPDSGNLLEFINQNGGALSATGNTDKGTNILGDTKTLTPPQNTNPIVEALKKRLSSQLNGATQDTTSNIANYILNGEKLGDSLDKAHPDIVATAMANIVRDALQALANNTDASVTERNKAASIIARATDVAISSNAGDAFNKAMSSMVVTNQDDISHTVKEYFNEMSTKTNIDKNDNNNKETDVATAPDDKGFSNSVFDTLRKFKTNDVDINGDGQSYLTSQTNKTKGREDDLGANPKNNLFALIKGQEYLDTHKYETQLLTDKSDHDLWTSPYGVISNPIHALLDTAADNDVWNYVDKVGNDKSKTISMSASHDIMNKLKASGILSGDGEGTSASKLNLNLDKRAALKRLVQETIQEAFVDNQHGEDAENNNRRMRALLEVVKTLDGVAVTPKPKKTLIAEIKTEMQASSAYKDTNHKEFKAFIDGALGAGENKPKTIEGATEKNWEKLSTPPDTQSPYDVVTQDQKKDLAAILNAALPNDAQIDLATSSYDDLAQAAQAALGALNAGYIKGFANPNEPAAKNLEAVLKDMITKFSTRSVEDTVHGKTTTHDEFTLPPNASMHFKVGTQIKSTGNGSTGILEAVATTEHPVVIEDRSGQIIKIITNGLVSDADGKLKITATDDGKPIAYGTKEKIQQDENAINADRKDIFDDNATTDPNNNANNWSAVKLGEKTTENLTILIDSNGQVISGTSQTQGSGGSGTTDTPTATPVATPPTTPAPAAGSGGGTTTAPIGWSYDQVASDGSTSTVLVQDGTNNGNLPGRLDAGDKRSFDGGKTWYTIGAAPPAGTSTN